MHTERVSMTPNCCTGVHVACIVQLEMMAWNACTRTAVLRVVQMLPRRR